MMSLPRVKEAVYALTGPGPTFNEVAEGQLRALCRGLGWEQETQGCLELQRFLFQPWGDYQVPRQPLFASLIGDDHSPYEYSLAFEGSSVELRILFEAQGEAPDATNNLHAARAFNSRLKHRFAQSFARFELLEDLFLAGRSHASFSLWHAACLSRGKLPEFKIYLNPAAHDTKSAHEVVNEALDRLGFSAASAAFLRSVAFRGEQDELKYFSLDLSGSPEARIKLYFAHHDVKATELERAFAFAPTHQRGDVIDYCRRMVGSEGPFVNKPLTSCFAFVAGRDRPSAATLHVPIAHYLQDDAVGSQRIAAYLASQCMPAEAYLKALSAFATRSLANGPGIQSYASFRRQPNGMRVTIYLSPELFDRTCARYDVKRTQRTVSPRDDRV